MKRTDITELFPEATPEQIQRLMDINGADINNARKDTDTLRTQLQQAQSALASKGDDDSLAAATARITELEAKLTGMENAENIRKVREKVAGEKKIPVSLLTGDTEEACAAQADQILEFAKPQSYPNLPDGGEPHGGASKPTTREQFAQWFGEITK